jgi:threonine dehydratase
VTDLKIEVERRIAANGLAAAREAIAGYAIRTPLLPFSTEGGREVRIKPECLQPYGSFKVRPAANVLAD